MKIVVFGKTGQVATELSRLPGVIAIDRQMVDFADPDRVSEFARDAKADAFINAAAYTAVDRAEEEEAIATTINGATPGVLAAAAAARRIPLVHISTDYVFDGSGTVAWTPDNVPAPLGAYGRSKLAGEVSLRKAGGTHAILRTSWVFSAHGGNFVKTMLRLAGDRDRLCIVSDQIGGPTPAAAIADACMQIAARLADDPGRTGIYHFAGAPDVSWAGFASEIFARAKCRVAIDEIATENYPTPAARPRNSRLDCSSLRDVFGIERPDWRLGLDAVLVELGAV